MPSAHRVERHEAAGKSIQVDESVSPRQQDCQILAPRYNGRVRQKHAHFVVRTEAEGDVLRAHRRERGVVEALGLKAVTFLRHVKVVGNAPNKYPSFVSEKLATNLARAGCPVKRQRDIVSENCEGQREVLRVGKLPTQRYTVSQAARFLVVIRT